MSGSRSRVEGRRWFGLVYRTAYRLGLTVWQREAPPSDLIDLIEGPSALRPGRALDLGCGTGTDSVYVASHGWEVTGVDMVPRALVQAARRAAAAHVSPRFIVGDVTRLQDFGVGSGYTLILDFGCFHTLPRDRRDAYAESVTEAAAKGATLLLYGFTRPPKLAPMHAGVNTDEVSELFGSKGWDLLNAEPVSADALLDTGRGVGDWFEAWRYRLRLS